MKVFFEPVTVLFLCGLFLIAGLLLGYHEAKSEQPTCPEGWQPVLQCEGMTWGNWTAPVTPKLPLSSRRPTG